MTRREREIGYRIYVLLEEVDPYGVLVHHHHPVLNILFSSSFYSFSFPFPYLIWRSENETSATALSIGT